MAGARANLYTYGTQAQNAARTEILAENIQIILNLATRSTKVTEEAIIQKRAKSGREFQIAGQIMAAAQKNDVRSR